MKKMLLVLILMLMIPVSAFGACSCGCEGAQMAKMPAWEGNQQLVFDTLRLETAFPKNAQVVSAMEYLCKMENEQLHVLLIHATQDETIEMMWGYASRIIMVDLDTGDVHTYKNISYPENSEIASKEDALKTLYAHFDSYLNGANEFVYADHEMTYPLTEEETAQINEALVAFFAQ